MNDNVDKIQFLCSEKYLSEKSGIFYIRMMMDDMKNIWSEIESIVKQSKKKVTVFNGDYETGKKECNELQIPLDSVLSSIVLHSCGFTLPLGKPRGLSN